MSKKRTATRTPEAPALPVLDTAPIPTSAVQHTTEYGQFRSIISNREVNEGHVRRLMAAITLENLLHLRPIDVTPEFGVIDGQHRLEAAERLGLPIYYQVGQQLNQRHISVLNSVSKHWAGMDYLNFYMLEGNEDYKKISQFVSHFPKIGISAALSMLSLHSRGNMQGFRAGEFKVTRSDEALAVAGHVKNLADRYDFKFAFTDACVKAMDTVVRTGKYDHERMVRKIDQQPRALMRCPTVRDYVEMFEELFNYNATAATRVHFR